MTNSGGENNCSTRKPPKPNIGDPAPFPYPYANAPTFPGPNVIGPQPEGMPLHACMGLNACKASDRFGLTGPADGPYAGVPNQCAGQGYCSTTTDHTCHVTNECRNQGGCGLYGTAEELNNPGQNDCKSLGSCATPINAERFSTTGPNQGKSVWARAREVFEQNWPKLQKKLRQKQYDKGIGKDQPLPEELSAAPAPFSDTGPPYLWVSKNNEQRGNMTACGASGMSGAGGCG